MNKLKATLSTSLKVVILTLVMLTTSLWPLNASAIDFNADIRGTAIEPYWRAYNDTTSSWTQWRRGGNEVSNTSSIYSHWQIRDSASSSSTITMYPQSVFGIELQVNNSSTGNSCSISTNGLGSNETTRLFAIENVQTNDNYRKYILYILHRSTSQETGYIDVYFNATCGNGVRFQPITWFQYIPTGEQLDTIKTYLNDIKTNTNNINNSIGTTNTRLQTVINQLNDITTNYLDVIVDELIEMNSEQEQTNNSINQNREEGQNAQQQANTSGASSSTDAGSAGQTLLGAFQSFLGALNVQPSNCELPMDTGYIDFGTVDLCELDPPPAFQAISSIVVIGFAVPLSLACARKIIELFRSFQS